MRILSILFLVAMGLLSIYSIFAGHFGVKVIGAVSVIFLFTALFKRKYADTLQEKNGRSTLARVLSKIFIVLGVAHIAFLLRAVYFINKTHESWLLVAGMTAAILLYFNLTLKAVDVAFTEKKIEQT